MKQRTQQEIQAEIKALEGCKAYAPHYTLFGDDNHRKLDLQIEYLKGEIDPTAQDEWESFSDDEQSAILEAQDWKERLTDESPSSGWDDRKMKFATAKRETAKKKSKKAKR